MKEENIKMNTNLEINTDINIDNNNDNDKERKIYQGIGEIYGYVYKGEGGRYFIRFKSGVEYFLFVNEKLNKGLGKQIEKNPLLYCKVYPQYNFKINKVFFMLIGWGEEEHEGYKSGEFILRGVHQKIPQFKSPVFSIYRNYIKGIDVENLKGRRAQHLPMIWKNADGSIKYAYKYNKLVEGNKPVFESIKVRFLDKLDMFAFIERLEEKTEEIPRKILSPAKLKALKIKLEKRRKQQKQETQKLNQTEQVKVEQKERINLIIKKKKYNNLSEAIVNN